MPLNYIAPGQMIKFRCSLAASVVLLVSTRTRDEYGTTMWLIHVRLPIQLQLIPYPGEYCGTRPLKAHFQITKSRESVSFVLLSTGYAPIGAWPSDAGDQRGAGIVHREREGEKSFAMYYPWITFSCAVLLHCNWSDNSHYLYSNSVRGINSQWNTIKLPLQSVLVLVVGEPASFLIRIVVNENQFVK